MSTKNKVLVNKAHFNGNPYVEGTRLTVFDVVMDCNNDGVGAFLSSQEEISMNDLRYVLQYCKTRQCDKDNGHCGGCSLRSLQDGVHSEQDFVNRFSRVTFVDSDEVLEGVGEGTMIMPGTPSDLPQTWRGQDVWLIASELFENL